MSIIVTVGGGFGNHLLSFWAGCILANKNNMKLLIKGNAIQNDSNIQRNDTRTTIHKLVNLEYVEINTHYINSDKDYESTLSNDLIGINKYYISSNDDYLQHLLVDLDTHMNYVVGYTSNLTPNMSFFSNHIQTLKKYLIPDIYIIENDISNSIVVSLRLGMGDAEVAIPSPFEKELRLPFIYYYDSIRKCAEMNNNIKKIFILSDNYTDKYLDQFDIFKDTFSIEYCNTKNTYEQFKYIINSQYFISSNSSFSIISSILNETGVIIFPNFKENDSPYPGIENARYSYLNTNTPNLIKLLIDSHAHPLEISKQKPTINYIIATHASINKRRESKDPNSRYILRYHLQILDSFLTSDTLITQITIVCPDVLDETGEYYTKNDAYINSLRAKGIAVVIMPVANEGISYTQYVKCFKKYNTFDYYIIMEDDWVINKKYLNFDTILVDLYQKTFTNNIGFLDYWSPLNHPFLPFHSAITVGMLSNETIKAFLHLDHKELISLEQLHFSHVLTNAGISITDHHRAGFSTRILFWETSRGIIRDHTQDAGYIQENPAREPIFLPVQCYYSGDMIDMVIIPINIKYMNGF
jgi:hypothetical protein